MEVLGGNLGQNKLTNYETYVIMIINKTFIFHTYLGGKEKSQFALPNDGLSERVSIHSIALDRLLDLSFFFFLNF